MRLILSALLYAALGSVANPAAAGPAADPASSPAAAIARAVELREGDMKKLVFHAEPRAVSGAEFTDPQGGSHRLADYAGQVVLVNFWATWCAPCRKEMPTLEALQEALGGEDFRVLTIATGRNTPAAIDRFFAEAGVENLPVLLDPRSTLAREMAVFGLPTTVLLDRDGREIARLTGDADWASDSALAVLGAVVGMEKARR